MNNFKRIHSLVLFIFTALLALALLVSASVIITSADGTPAKADAVSVSLDGRINLNFKFETSKIEGYTAASAKIGETDADPAVTADGDKTIFTVALMPYQMTEEVVLTISSDNRVIASSTSSVLAYANKILESNAEVHVEAHDAIRAMLNYGAMTQIDAGKNTDALANAGVFTRNNPKDAVTQIPLVGGESSAALGGVFAEGSSVNLVFNEGDIALKYTVVYNGSKAADLTATVKVGETTQASEIKLAKDGENYSFTISNLGVNSFATVWTVEITDGEKTISSSHSVLEYLKWNITTDDASVTATQKDVCRTLYQLYQYTVATPDQNKCQHANAGYMVSADNSVGYSYYKCISCNKQMSSTPIHNDVDVYIPGSVFATVPISTASGGTKLDVTSNEYGELNAKWMTVNSDAGSTIHIRPLCEKFCLSSGLKEKIPADGGDGQWNMENNGGEIEPYDSSPSYSFDIGKAAYVVISFSVNESADTEKCKIELSLGSSKFTYKDQTSSGQNGVYSKVALPCTAEGKVTYVISLDHFGEKVDADDAGNRKIDGLMISAKNFATGDTLTIDHIAFVDNSTDAERISDSGEIIIIPESDQ